EWDPAKALANERKHGVSFREAAFVFGDDDALYRSDPAHSEDEDRFIIIGVSSTKGLLTVAYTYRGEDTIRIINARTAERAEQNAYEENLSSRR
ncbi:MAG TPA: BrnT family toxin, partial [Thermoanaerobaculia bacterium]|nr:BrnT family toxin [Thermoanaerobaculia bacterium]